MEQHSQNLGDVTANQVDLSAASDAVDVPPERLPVLPAPTIEVEDTHVASALERMEPGIYTMQELLIAFRGKAKVPRNEFTGYTNVIKREQRIQKIPFSVGGSTFKVVPDPESPIGRDYIELEEHLGGVVRKLYGSCTVNVTYLPLMCDNYTAR